MFGVLSGRIDRRTYVAGNLVALGVLFIFCCLIVVPVAILSLAVANKTFDSIISLLYVLLILPALLYYFYFIVLMVKRAHDVGWPGLLIAILFTVAMVLGRDSSLWFFNVAGLVLVAFFCIKPGTKSRNTFGPVPRKKFSVDNLKLTF